MKVIPIVVGIAVVVSLRVWVFVRRRRRRAAPKTQAGVESGTVSEAVHREDGLTTSPSPVATASSFREVRGDAGLFKKTFGDVGLVASREIRERLHGRIFRVGTIVMLVGVGAAVVIPALHKTSKTLTLQKVGVDGRMSAETRDLVLAAAASNQDKIVFVPESSVAQARADLKRDTSYLSIIGTKEVLTYLPASSSSSPADMSLVQDVAETSASSTLTSTLA